MAANTLLTEFLLLFLPSLAQGVYLFLLLQFLSKTQLKVSKDLKTYV